MVTLDNRLEGVLLQGGCEQAWRVPGEARECGGCCCPDVVVLGSSPDGDQVGHDFTAGKACGPFPCLAANVLYGLHGIVLHITCIESHYQLLGQLRGQNWGGGGGGGGEIRVERRGSEGGDGRKRQGWMGRKGEQQGQKQEGGGIEEGRGGGGEGAGVDTNTDTPAQ